MALDPDPEEVDSPEKVSSKRGKEATQDRILQAAMNLFIRRGFSRTSVTQIANKAGVSRAAVFWHFSDKDSLFRAAAKQFVVPFREALGRKLTHLEPRKHRRQTTKNCESKFEGIARRDRERRDRAFAQRTRGKDRAAHEKPGDTGPTSERWSQSTSGSHGCQIVDEGVDEILAIHRISKQRVFARPASLASRFACSIARACARQGVL
jgi:AcrR family transcriptional regulator